VARLVYKASDGTKYDVGCLWPARKHMPGHIGSLSPQTKAEGGNYPKMPLAEALERVANRDGFIDCWSTERRNNDTPRPRQQESDGGADPFGSDDSIPFAPRGGVL
jgi:hypothetical protein